MGRQWEATSVTDTTINGTSFCGRKINWDPTACNHDIHLLLQNWHGGMAELGYMALENKSVMAIHRGTKQQYRVYILLCSNTLGSFLITISLPNWAPCYRLDILQLLMILTKMKECEAYTVGGCPPAHVFLLIFSVYTLQKIFTQFRRECKLEVFGAETITNCFASRKYFTIKR
jgi:hypothetical protein